MGREFPVGENAAEIHPFISMSLLIACVAATIAVVSSLCGALSRKRKASTPVAGNEMKENKHINVQSPTDHADHKNHGSPPTSDSENATQNEELLQQPLPPPPGMQRLSGTASYHYRSNSSASSSSQRKLPTSMSMKALGNGFGISSRQSSKRDQDNSNNNIDHKKKDKKLKHEDSIWKKTIILGEKCKVPDEDDDSILYDEKGNRISTYHRKSTSLALSRQSSNVDPDAIPSY